MNYSKNRGLQKHNLKVFPIIFVMKFSECKCVISHYSKLNMFFF